MYAKSIVVFTQEDLLSILPTPVQKDLPAIGVLSEGPVVQY